MKPNSTEVVTAKHAVMQATCKTGDEVHRLFFTDDGKPREELIKQINELEQQFHEAVRKLIEPKSAPTKVS